MCLDCSGEFQHQRDQAEMRGYEVLTYVIVHHAQIEPYRDSHNGSQNSKSLHTSVKHDLLQHSQHDDTHGEYYYESAAHCSSV
jgi:hypothetical protein